MQEQTQVTLAPEAIELFNAMAAAIKSKEQKAEKEKAKFVMIVDGKVMSQLIPSKTEAEEAARAIALKALATTGKMPKINIAAINETLTVGLPVTSTATDGIAKEK